MVVLLPWGWCGGRVLVGTMVHVLVYIFMVFTEVEKVMVIAIGGFEIVALYCDG
jgi:hypothetical protein